MGFLQVIDIFLSFVNKYRFVPRGNIINLKLNR